MTAYSGARNSSIEDQGNRDLYNYDTYKNNSEEIDTFLPKDAWLSEWRILATIFTAIFITGVIGNTLILCISCKKNNRKKSFMLYLAALSIADTLAMSRSMLNRLHVFRVINIYRRDIICKLSFFLLNGAAFTSCWLLVAIAIERAVSARWPLEVVKISSRTFGRKTIIYIIIIAYILCSHYLYGIISVEGKGTSGCLALVGTYLAFYNSYWPWVVILLQSIIPGTLLVICNTVMIKAVFKSSKVRGSYQAKRKNHDLMTIAILTSTVYIILTFPAPFFVILKGSLGYYYNLEDFVIGETLWVLSDVNNGINFFLYILSGNRFRRDLKNLFLCTN